MSLYRSSRYADEWSRDMMLQSDGLQTRTVTRRPPRRQVARGGFHLWRAGDRIDRIADWVLGDAKQAWRILDLNPQIIDANNIEPGTVVRLP